MFNVLLMMGGDSFVIVWGEVELLSVRSACSTNKFERKHRDSYRSDYLSFHSPLERDPVRYWVGNLVEVALARCEFEPAAAEVC